MFPKCKGLSNKLLPFTFITLRNKRSQKLPRVVHALLIIIIIIESPERSFAKTCGMCFPGSLGTRLSAVIAVTPLGEFVRVRVRSGQSR